MNHDGSQFGNVSGNVTIAQVGGNVNGDIVGGDKTTIINNIIQQAAKKIIADPYKFLDSYSISDRDIFFGRDAVIEELVSNIPRHKILIINGRSGSGKTSLIHAGLIPRLADNGYHYLSFRDYDKDPIRQLREYALQDDFFRNFAEQAHSIMHFVKTVTRQKKIHLAVIFDQFERFFVNVPLALRTQFIQEFKACIDSDLSGDELDVVFALREDFIGTFIIEFEKFIPQFFNQSFHYNLLPLNKEEAREAIIRPLKNIPLPIRYNLQFVDEVLLPGLMGESANETQIAPSNLQIVCNQLYQEVRKRYAADLEEGGVQIDRALYEQLGGTSEILRTYLDDFIVRTAHGDTGERDVLRSMLKLMLDTTGTRKFVGFADLKFGLPDVQPSAIEQHIRAFQDGRIIETRGEGEAARYSLSHDVMVEKVKKWFDERELQRKKAQETLERGVAEWRSTEALLNEKQVEHIRAWLRTDTLDEQAELLLTRSQQTYEERQRKEAQQEHRLRRNKRIVRNITSGIVILCAALFVAFYVIPSRSYFFTIKNDDVARTIIVQQGHPLFNVPFLKLFPKEIRDQNPQTKYTVNEIANVPGLFTKSFRNFKDREHVIVPFLKPAEQPEAYEKIGDIEQAIQAAVGVIDKSKGADDSAKERAALVLIRHLDRISDESLRRQAIETSANIGVGLTLEKMEKLIKTGAPDVVVNAANEIKTRVEKRITANMVKIPAGEFIMGIQKKDIEKLKEKYPSATDNYLNSEIHPNPGWIEHDFFIDRYEVTNEEYVYYLNRIGRHSNEEGFFLVKTQNMDSESRIRQEGKTYQVDAEYLRHPVVKVTWYGAKDYCEWLGKRLPTASEWERAARGEQGNRFPWGNDFDAQNANVRAYWEGTGESRTCEVGHFKKGVSYEGVYDLAGNVWEWTDSPMIVYDDNPYEGNDSYRALYDDQDIRVIRGGSYLATEYATRTSQRYPLERERTSVDLGFRCGRDIAHDE